MARHKKRFIPRRRSALTGAALLVAARQLRRKQKWALSFSRFLEWMGKGLLTERIAYYSPRGVVALLGSYLLQQQVRRHWPPIMKHRNERRSEPPTTEHKVNEPVEL